MESDDDPVASLYQRLLKRGMPGHKRLSYRPDGSLSRLWSYDKLEQRLYTPDVLPMLASHVRRWLVSLRSDSPRLYKPEITINWYEHDDICTITLTSVKSDGVHCHQTFHYQDPDLSMLEFAVAATGFLEK